MKALFILVFLIVTSYKSYSQFKFFYIDSNKPSDAHAIIFPSLLHSKHLFHFRFWDYPRALEVYTDDHMAFKGWIYFYQEVDKKMHSQKILLDTATAKWVYKLLNEHSIFQLPAAKDMATWSECFDTNYFEMEQSTPFHYSKKGYGQPCRNNYNKDEGVFMSVVTSLRQNPKIAFLLKQFLDSLPEGYYMTGGGLYALQKQRYLKSLGF